MITHTVLMKFADVENAPEAVRRLEALPVQIAQVKSLSAGLDVARTEVSYDLVLVTTHDDLDQLVAYQQHPAHAEFGAWLRPLLTARAVVDAAT